MTPLLNFGKTNSIKWLWSVVLLVLALLTPTALWANSALEFKETARSKKILAEAPKTLEELLKVIKEFMDNPDMNGYEFVEDISGIDRLHWGPESVEETSKGRKYKLYAILCPKCPYGLNVEEKQNLPTVYYVRNINISLEDDSLISVGIGHLSPKKELNNASFLLSPRIVRSFFKEPTSVSVTSARSEYSPGYYTLQYTYDIGKTYRLSFSFRAKDDELRELRRQRRKHTSEQAREERKWRKEFANHKKFIALGLSLMRQL